MKTSLWKTTAVDIKRLTLTLAMGVMCAGTADQILAVESAQESFPSRPVHIVVPFPAGGSMDVLARQIAQHLGQRWNQAVVVDNRAGASGMIGLNSVAKSPPDGYTLGVVANSFVANPLLRDDIPYDAFKDFSPVSLMASVPFVLTVSSSLPATSLSDFVTHAKENQGALNYSSGGNGTMSHLGGEMLKQALDIDAAHIPYKGQAPALTDVVSGHVSFTLGNLPEVISHLKADKVHAPAILAGKRSPLLPDTPTLAEAGYGQLEIGSWYGLVAPRGTPEQVVKQIQEAISEAVSQPDFRSKLENQGFEVFGGTPAQFEKFMKQESATYKQVIESAGIKEAQ